MIVPMGGPRKGSTMKREKKSIRLERASSIERARRKEETAVAARLVRSRRRLLEKRGFRIAYAGRSR